MQGYYSGGYDEWDDAEACGADAYEGFQSASAVKGTCQELEKSYFRLTSKPDPSAVRPETVLKRALARLVIFCLLPLPWGPTGTFQNVCALWSPTPSVPLLLQI